MGFWRRPLTEPFDGALKWRSVNAGPLARYPVEIFMAIEQEIATNQGLDAGTKDAQRIAQDPACFEATSNPYGVDSESVQHEAWEVGYESTFENRR
jgi:hypothetical protein